MICHRCWHEFPLEDLLSIAESNALESDPVLGTQERLRFFASRFDVEGNAIDPEGSVCNRFACPRCRLQIPRAIMDCDVAFISLLGAPASGKSFLLATATWSLRQLSEQLPVDCNDPDPVANARLHEAEALLFRPASKGRLVSLEKTETSGPDRYDETRLGGKSVALPRPYVIKLDSRNVDHKPIAIALYDNAGEHHLPTESEHAEQATGHLRRATASIVLIDPIQHPELRQICSTDDPQVGLEDARTNPPPRQELVIAQAAANIRSMQGLREDEKIEHPLIIAVSKADTWAERIPESARNQPLLINSNGQVALDHQAVDTLSNETRKILAVAAPEITGAAQAFGEKIIYLPVSSTGQSPEVRNQESPTSYDLGVRGGEIQPRWVAECLLIAVEMARPGQLFRTASVVDKGMANLPESSSSEGLIDNGV